MKFYILTLFVFLSLAHSRNPPKVDTSRPSEMVNNRSQGEYNCVKISKFDLSKEGDITGLDLIIAQKIQLGYIIGGLDQMKDFDASVLDVNSDDRFNKADVDIVQKYILGIICK